MQARIAAFQQGLEQYGWAIGGNVRIDTRFATAVAEIPGTRRNWPHSRPT